MAQKEIVVCLGRVNDDWTSELHLHKTFPNAAKGFGALIQWVEKCTAPETSVMCVMEATGVYQEALAYFLKNEFLNVAIVLPNKIKITPEVSQQKRSPTERLLIPRFPLGRLVPRKLFEKPGRQEAVFVRST